MYIFLQYVPPYWLVTICANFAFGVLMLIGYCKIFWYSHINTHLPCCPTARDPLASLCRDRLPATKVRRRIHTPWAHTDTSLCTFQEALLPFCRMGACQDTSVNPTSKNAASSAGAGDCSGSWSSATPRKKRLVEYRKDRTHTKSLVARINIVAFLIRNIRHRDYRFFRQCRCRRTTAVFSADIHGALRITGCSASIQRYLPFCKIWLPDIILWQSV